MSTNQDTEYSKEKDGLTKYFTDAKDEPLLFKRMSEDPLEVLQSMGIPVEDQFKEAVTSQLRAAVDLTSPQAPEREANLMSAEAKRMSARPAAPTGLRVQQDTMPPEVQKAVDFWVKPWGLVLVVREPAVKYLQGGGAISAGALGGIAAVAGVTGPFGVAVAVIVGICAAALGIYSGVITIMDQGKGVYLTWTWAQLIPALPQYGLPLVTPIK
jgi:hypothetical protein